MNYTKWGEFLDVAFENGLRGLKVTVKMLWADTETSDFFLRRISQRCTDLMRGPVDNRDIEWVKVDGPPAARILEHLQRLGQLPIVRIEDGFRLQAYGLISGVHAMSAAGGSK
jgi:hypothetical protein